MTGVQTCALPICRHIPISLGSDAANCGTNHNMLEILRLFLLIQRSKESNYDSWITVKDGYKMITSNGSAVLGFPQPSGEIKANYAADLVVVDKNDFLDVLETTLPNQLVFNTSSLSVKHVFINGRFVMKEKNIIGIDENSLRNEILERKPYLRKAMIEALKKASNDKLPYQSIYKKLDLSSL